MFQANYVGRDDVAKQLMSEQDPLVIKRLGDSIKIPRDNDWDKVKLQIMQNIVKEKFTQTSHLKRLLIETGEKNIVHATSDRFWGCGHNLYSSWWHKEWHMVWKEPYGQNSCCSQRRT